MVLFDEVEKAHPDVFNIFLQILDDGHLTDGQGRVVSFKNTIIIMTSNIGSDIILNAPALEQTVKDGIMQLIRKQFRPEFINRLDAIIFFRQLTQEDMLTIAEIQINHLKKRLAQQEIMLTVDAAVLNHLAAQGYEREFGARPLKRTIAQKVMAPLAKFMLEHPQQKSIHVALNKNEIGIK